MQKALVVLLTVSFALSPIAQAFAQSSDASATASSATATATSDTSISNLGAPASTDSSTASAPATTDSTPGSTLGSPSAPGTPATPPPSAPPPAPPPPSGGSPGPTVQPIAYSSFNQDHLTIDKNTGVLSTSYPITIPPGRNNLQPDLDLNYNSQNSQLGSVFGEGWSIAIPYLERLNKTGVDNFYNTSTISYFLSSLDGELATTTVSSNYIARTENGTFNKYTFSSSTNQWVMTDKNGTQYTFGSTSDSKQSDPSNSANVYKWMLRQVVDTNNNNITYSYFKDAGQIYPSSTVYTGNGTSTGIFEVDFLRASSGDNGTSSLTGFAVKSNYRVSEIDASVNGTWVRKYALAYAAGDNGSTTLLHSITESGQNASGTTVTLPAVTFSYQTQTAGWTSSSTWNPPIIFSNNTGDYGVRRALSKSDSIKTAPSRKPTD